MTKLTRAIQELEHEIILNKQTIYHQYQKSKISLKQQISTKISSPPSFVFAFIFGGFAIKKIRRKWKQKAISHKTSARKLPLLQKILSLSSEATLAFQTFHRYKPLLNRWVQKVGRSI